MPSTPMGSFHRFLSTRTPDSPAEFPPEWDRYLHYVAGMFEVGGYCYIGRTQRAYATYLSIRSVTGDRVAKLVNTLGGTMGGPGLWRIGATGGVTVARHLLPYLKERRREVEIWLKARRIIDGLWFDRAPWNPERRAAMEACITELAEERARLRAIAQECYRVSRRMPVTSTSTSPSEEQERQTPPAS